MATQYEALTSSITKNDTNAKPSLLSTKDMVDFKESICVIYDSVAKLNTSLESAASLSSSKDSNRTALFDIIRMLAEELTSKNETSIPLSTNIFENEQMSDSPADMKLRIQIMTNNNNNTTEDYEDLTEVNNNNSEKDDDKHNDDFFEIEEDTDDFLDAEDNTDNYIEEDDENINNNPEDEQDE